ncbi:hypothetical protein PF005_g31035 [Phytophthora fragariae]|uniref:Uncharacterized protein n=1 Tax=Phytophthora fragariae TaxID=53985 RepID=A0A6A3DC04_9STRA|nr:hypothetical protein PF003_g36741 [Phytophthora fragariae]KAE8918515.1 hypothetical protein PF009_g31172 [Phytophthora fragariae]KAE8959981.1 hypothetical protein PF011_g30248 [Phytophthora fragariae]KAE9059298.1 hypothetical protein PF010_g30671 [Phytophthora fragariae]KAE9060220.1 hypothetical protein PF007_g30687 [Phytophthora fragariae]
MAMGSSSFTCAVIAGDSTESSAKPTAGSAGASISSSGVAQFTGAMSVAAATSSRLTLCRVGGRVAT